MKTNKQHIIRFLQVMLIIAFGILFVFIFTASKVKQGEVICREIVVEIDSEETDLHFLEEEEVQDLIADGGQEIIINQPLSKIDLSAIETRLETNDFIDRAEVYTNFEGTIKASISQKTPKYRVINNQGVSYYISKTGTKMPLSSKFTPRLIVATGFIPNVQSVDDDEINENISNLVDFIEADDFWTAMIGQIYVEEDGNFILIPKIEGHIVELGKGEKLVEKFSKLKLFYKQALPYTAWENYQTINLKYEGQIVCTKN